MLYELVHLFGTVLVFHCGICLSHEVPKLLGVDLTYYLMEFDIVLAQGGIFRVKKQTTVTFYLKLLLVQGNNVW